MRTRSLAPAFLPLVLLAAGCVSPVGDIGAVDAVAELLVEGGVTGARAAAAHRTVVGGADGLVLREEGGAPVTLSALSEPPLAAAEHGGELLVLTDSGLFVVSANQLASTPLSAALDAAPLEMSAAGGALWLRTPGGVWLHRNGTLSAVEVTGHTLTGPIAASVAADGTPLLWVGAEDTLLAIDVAGAVRADRAGAVQSLAADDTGVWAVADGDLLRGVDGGADPDTWSRYTLPSPLLAVAADPAAAGAWIHAEDRVFRALGGEADAFTALATDALPGLVGLTADPLGRLLAWDGADLHRVTDGRVLDLVGLEDGAEVEAAATITLLPTAPDEVTAVTAAVDDVALTPTFFDGEWSVTLDALAWAGGGEHTLVATATYTGGQVATSAPLRFTVGALSNIGWAADVAPIHEAACALCHEGDTVTILDGPAAWEANIDSVLVQIGEGRMPLAGDPLTDGEVAVVAAWRAGGFLP